MMLRALQLGLRLEDLAILESGQVLDLIIESKNDGEKYPYIATTEDYDKFFGG